MTDRIEVPRTIAASAADIFAVLCDPQGHVAIDSSGMLQDADGEHVTASGDSFVVHMDRESLNDFPDLGKYDVTVTIQEFEKDRLISWTILGKIRPQIGHVYGYRLEPTVRRHRRHVVLRLGPTSTRNGVRPTSFRSSPRARCVRRSAFSTARSGAATRLIDREVITSPGRCPARQGRPTSRLCRRRSCTPGRQESATR